jgi:hypothetical protein
MARNASQPPGDGPPGHRRFPVAYYRVSTDRQGLSGLGLDAQRQTVENFAVSAGGSIVSEFREIESGKNNARPEIAAAIAACRARRATLLIAKLDRLARNVAFVSGLMEAGIDFIACDMPFANRLTVHILASVAEHENMPDLLSPHEVATSRGIARYYVFRVHSIVNDGGEPLVSVTGGPFVGFLDAWYSAGAIHRIYPDQIFIAGEIHPDLLETAQN